MQIIDTAIPEVKIVVPKVFGDDRGYFFESWNEEKYSANGINCRWVQDNESRSKYGVLRGLHYQAAPYTQAKLVRVIEGAVLDVALDIRKNSPTFGKHVAVELSAENKYQLFVPRGFAHGFVVLTESVTFAYKCDNTYMPSHERGIAFNDPALGIDWKVELDKFILSPKDMKNPLLADAELFDYNNQEYLK
ncbi:MAG: dTDP-4-dehydrorhamnose 3,5-epimerase [Lentisphaerae bacterium]|nr:dTDP-4-dehydrorhamnose 3,5-epimerase [Lentisphaerota bacterium]MBQ4329092.1 dTDP-4-dehydrorhamnose 3,5-epimerase [Lentisphaeria bacterium]MBR2720281.1 dTDP-4-dehydrorhamnose 3,5-epimerase [Lentisphaeria bacterium]